MRTRVAAVTGAVLVATCRAAPPAHAAGPEPVLDSSAADPAVARTDDGFVVATTGRRAPMATSPTPAGSWEVAGTALPQDLPDWVTATGVWAPELRRVGDSWVFYFSVHAAGMSKHQRCIGAATSSAPTGPFASVGSSPLVCPENDADDRVPGRPVAEAGAVDPSVYQAPDGNLFLLYKTQKLPASLRIVPLDPTGTRVRSGATSRELVRSNQVVIENPVLEEHDGRFVLFASNRGYRTCDYRTIYMKGRSLGAGAFQGAPRRTLLSSVSTGLCGPGGADVAPAGNGERVLFHGWVCRGMRPCPSDFSKKRTPNRGQRVMYARGLRWNGSTPALGAWLHPPT